MPRVPKYNDLSQFEKPEVTWDFYDAIHSSAPTKAAIEAGTNSIEEDNLDKYVKQTLRTGTMSSLAGFLAATQKKNPYAYLPDPFDKLIPLQNADGRWYPLKKVLKILRLPKDTVLEKATIWEMASAFVLAYIRQKIDIFHLTEEFHDKAIVHFPTQELIVQAKEIILVNDLTLELRDLMKSRGVEPQPDSRYDYSDNEEDEDSVSITPAGDDVDETIGNQATWTPKTGGLLEHANADLSSDPFMQIPNQQEYERMTAEKVQQSGTGCLPRAKMTTMMILGEDDALCKEAYEMDSDEEGNDTQNQRTTTEEDSRGVTFAPSLDITVASSDHTETDTSIIKSALKGSSSRPGSSSGKVTFQMVDGERPRLVGEDAFDKLDYRLGDELSITTPPAFSETSLEPLEDGNGSKGSKLSSQASSGDKIKDTGDDESKGKDGDDDAVVGKKVEKFVDSETIVKREESEDVQSDQSDAVVDPGMSITPTALDALDALSKNVDSKDDGEVPAVDESIDESKCEPTGGDPVQNTTATIDATQLGKPQRDEAKISAAKEVLDRIMIDAVLACEEIERHCDLIKDCLARSIIEYNETLTFDERNLTFDQLTALLGDDCPPREGFLDWRREGCPGMRPKVVRFMNLIYDMARQRLRVTELETPEGRPVGMPDIVPLDREWLWDDGKEEDCDDVGRWSFVWNGEDMVKKVLHSLDFLRNQRELCNWYGRAFFFTANPMMLPFHIYPNHSKFEMNHYLKEMLMTKPHMRPMCSIGGTGYTLVGVAPGSPTWDKCGGDIDSLGQKDAWKFEKYLRNKWKVTFEECCEGAYVNWPNVPKLKQEADVEALFKAFMVIHVRCKKTVISTYRWEKKFISLLTTIRGQYLMKGESGLKPDLNLDRETEQKLIVMKEEHARQMEEQRRLEEERARTGYNANVGFLSSLMKASTGMPVVKIKSYDEIALERKMKERRRILKALMKPREHPNPDDLPLYLPFENWSSVNLDRPGSPNLGFGRSPTRSPATVSLPQLVPLMPGSPLMARTAAEHKAMRISLEEEAIAAARGPIMEETLPTKTGDSDDEEEDGGEGQADPKRGKKAKKNKKGKDKKNAQDGKASISKGGTRALEGLLPQGEKLSRAIITQAALDSSKVSRYVAPSSSQKYTRKSDIEVLPAVRKGGGAFQQQLPKTQPNRLPKAIK